MHDIKVLVPQRHEHTAQDQAQIDGPAAHGRVDQKVKRQQQQTAAEGERDQIVARLEGLDVLRGGQIQHRDVPAVLMYVVAVLDHQLDDVILSGAHGQGHVAHPGHKAFRGFGRIAKDRHLAAVHKHPGGIVHRKAADGVVGPGGRPDAQPMGTVGIVRGGDALTGRLACPSGREILAGIQLLGVEIPASLQLEQPGGGILALQVQPAVFLPEQAHRRIAQ